MTATPDYAALDVLAEEIIERGLGALSSKTFTNDLFKASPLYVLAHGYLALRKGVDYIELQKLIRKSGLTSLIQAKHIADAILSAFPQVGGKL